METLDRFTFSLAYNLALNYLLLKGTAKLVISNKEFQAQRTQRKGAQSRTAELNLPALN